MALIRAPSYRRPTGTLSSACNFGDFFSPPPPFSPRCRQEHLFTVTPFSSKSSPVFPIDSPTWYSMNIVWQCGLNEHLSFTLQISAASFGASTGLASTHLLLFLSPHDVASGHCGFLYGWRIPSAVATSARVWSLLDPCAAGCTEPITTSRVLLRVLDGICIATRIEGEVEAKARTRTLDRFLKTHTGGGR